MIKDISKIIPYYNELQKYCYILTGTKWDGEDLLQETIIKVLNKFPIDKRDMNNISKAYLFRISTNTWIDQCRKKKIVIEDFDKISIHQKRIYFLVMLLMLLRDYYII